MTEQSLETVPLQCTEGAIASSHDAILQTLDREIGGVLLNKEVFEPTLADWNGLPIVFAQEHPDALGYNDDPAKALSEVKDYEGNPGREVGRVADVHIDKRGHPRLMGKLLFKEPEMKQLVDEGRLNLSTSMLTYKRPSGAIAEIIPQNILVFVDGPTDRPRDPGTFILNKHSSNPIGDEKSMTDETNDAATQLVALQNKVDDLSNKNADLVSEVEKLEQTNADLMKEVQQFKQAEKDAQWTALQSKLPKGMVRDEATVAASRKEWEETPQQFMMKVVDTMAQQPAGTQVEGEQFKTEGKSKDLDPDNEFMISVEE